MSDVRCAFMRCGSQCSNPPDDARLVELPNGDHLVALFCYAHAKTYDALKWAATRR